MTPVVNSLALMLLAACGLLAGRLWCHLQKPAAVTPSCFRQWRVWLTARRLAVWVATPALCLTAASFLSHRTGLAEAYERALCGPQCAALPAEVLRLLAIKSYLHILLDERRAASDGWGYDQLTLLPVRLNAPELERGLQDETLLAMLTTHALPLKSHSDIDALQAHTLAAHPTIARLSLSHRTAAVTAIPGIRRFQLDGVDPDTRPRAEAARRIGRWERLRGYGAHFFQLTEYGGLDLSCCDGLGDRGSTSLFKRKQASLAAIHAIRAQAIAVSDRGVVLQWWDEMGESQGLSHRLFSFP